MKNKALVIIPMAPIFVNVPRSTNPTIDVDLFAMFWHSASKDQNW